MPLLAGRAVIEAELDTLRDFFTQHPEFDLLHAPLCDAVEFPLAPTLDLELLRAAQRLIRIIPDNDRTIALELLRSGVRSAVELADLSAPEFTDRYGKLFADDPVVTAEAHRRARVIRAHVHLRYMQMQQQHETRLPLSLNPIRRRN